MKQLKLIRTETGDQGTFGVIEVDGREFYTGELPWLDNVRGKSCIPAGTYQCAWSESAKYGMKYHVNHVPDRDHILIHAANFMGDEDKGFKHQVDGCIALGSSISMLDGQMAVRQSKDAVKDFEEMMGLEPFELTVTNGYEDIPTS